jgi:hypothetical protein
MHEVLPLKARPFNCRFLFLLGLLWVEALVFHYMEDSELPLRIWYMLQIEHEVTLLFVNWVFYLLRGTVGFTCHYSV